MVLINRTDKKYWSQAEGDQYWIDAEEFTQQRQAKTMQLSTYQQAVLDAIKQRITTNERPIKGLLIEALAGSGKSTQLWLIAQVLNEYGYTPDQCRFVVFGRKNKTDLENKMINKVGKDWGKSVSTLHSLSFSIFRDAVRQPAKYFRVDNLKYRKIAQQLGLIGHWESGRKQTGELVRNEKLDNDRDFIDLLEKLRLYCYEPTSDKVREISKRFKLGVKDFYVVTDAVKQCLEKGLKETYYGNLDFTDQSWALYQRRNEPEFKNAIASWQRQLKFISIDEAQDTDNLQIEILKLLQSENNFVCPVGDRYQAVYGFRGCLSDGLDKLQQTFNCEKLPLPVNYRCGKIHLNLVREIFPHIQIEPHSNAPKGEIRVIKDNQLLSIFSDNKKYSDFFGVCRKNAPLTKCCIQLLSSGIAAKVKDKSLGSKLVNLVEDICSKLKVRYEVEIFPQTISNYERAERVRLQQYPDGEERIDDLTDILEAIAALFEAYRPETIQDWKTTVDQIFDESDGQAVGLYSIHSGKGGEGKTAFILHPEEMPLTRKGQTSEELAQEYNLLYVALTRPLATADDPESGKLYLVLETKSDEFKYPSWLPEKMQKLWGVEEAIANEAPTQPSNDLVLNQKDQHSNELEHDAKDNLQLAGLEEAIVHCAGDWYGTAQVLRLIHEELKSTDDFTTYCKDKFGWSKRHCDRLIVASNVVDNLINAGLINDDIPSESVIRPIANLPTEQQLKVWEQATNYDRITAQLVEQLKAEVLAKTVSKAELIDQLINKFGIEYLVQMLQCNSEEEASDSTKSFCKGCGAEIIWIKTKTGKLTPNNLDGTTHWATCPNAKNFKR